MNAGACSGLSRVMIPSSVLFSSRLRNRSRALFSDRIRMIRAGFGRSKDTASPYGQKGVLWRATHRIYNHRSPTKQASGKGIGMAKRVLKKERGVFERPKGSGVWWINFYLNGKQRREKAGTRSAAIDL